MELLIPNTFEANWSNAKGESGKWEIPKELKCCSLSELQKYFASFPQGYLKSSFIQLADRFWINLNDILCLYAEYNAEIIVIGTDIDFELEDLKEMHILPGFETKSIIIGGQALSVKERELNFFYDSFDEYIDHWGQIFKWNKGQVELLKSIFSGNFSH